MDSTAFATAFLGLGSNMGDRVAILQGAVARLQAVPEIRTMRTSRFYRTRPWGDTDQGDFLNACAEISTSLPPLGLLDLCHLLEKEFGRTRGRRWGPRTLDIDILDYDQQVRSDEPLILPHPLAHLRGFVLVPLAELAPDLTIRGKRVRDWLAAADTNGIEPWKGTANDNQARNM
ncbi:MAG: 2-amino-4-hydroxy-6-hydroxymethyldihydropteridine diphosphokinase [Methylobacteriaceae bacterium]|jgi:2-amino-4-hydroxy-6-hydroxymethyldihydropteridine diphosphokinase|nr:2-amino-4-hydroxy-6-hydroxymethyldihydropteridine diphosphokinase [Methylobacteriaceae bacterium]